MGRAREATGPRARRRSGTLPSLRRVFVEPVTLRLSGIPGPAIGPFVYVTRLPPWAIELPRKRVEWRVWFNAKEAIVECNLRW
jgi:hypothetical protein